MRQLSLPSQQDGVRKRLTDPETIATAVELLREAGYTELAIWRYFIEAFAVDLDALSLILKELFGKAHAQRESRRAKPLPSSPRRDKARRTRAA
jgi:hypothetical protein